MLSMTPKRNLDLTPFNILNDGMLFCPNCGDSGGQLYDIEERDDSVGYRAIEVVCTRCAPNPAFATCGGGIYCNHCGGTADSVQADVMRFRIDAVCCNGATGVLASQPRRKVA